MSEAVLDASAILALLLGEAGAEAVAARVDGALVSTANLSEVAGHYARAGAGEEDVRAMLDALPVTPVPVDRETALLAGLMRRAGESAGLSLGDRLCLALAHRRDLPALTADRAWARVADDLGVRVEVLR